MATHRFALSAGHRNNGKGGASRGPESAWTYPVTVKLKDEINRRGGEAFIVQEVDGDTDLTFTSRELGATAKLAGEIGESRGGVDAYLSMHYGAEPVNGFFAIYPDATGLKPAGNYGTGHAQDIKDNNPLDVKLAKAIATYVAKTGMGIRGDGTMSETKSGVGQSGWRLGEMEGTIGIRAKSVRLILEGGNSLSDAEYALLWSHTWQDKYVAAIVDGLEEVFGKFSESGVVPSPEPEQAKRSFKLRFDTYLRTTTGFWDTDKNENNIIKLLKAGTTGTVEEGPKVVNGVEFYYLSIPGEKEAQYGWLQDQVLHTLEIKTGV